MRLTAQLPVLVLGAFLALPARAQTPTATDPPFPYAPPPGFAAPDGGVASVPEVQGPAVTEVPDAVPRPAPPRPAALYPTELPPVDESTYDASSYDAAAAEAQAYPPNGEEDLGADEAIADGYDDGYDPNAYAEFQQSLAPYGSWVNDAAYGEIWVPAVAIVGADFLPYFTNGHWILSEYGWTWVSDWGWGWAPFHYGRWLQTTQRGWCWIPGTTWGPAWVSWRSGGGYVGWAPLPPRGVTLAAAVPEHATHSAWRFALAGTLGATRATGLPPSRIPGIFGRTTVVANDRLLTHGPYAVHVNAGPVRASPTAPVRLATVAPRTLPKSAILPRPGTSIGTRPWARVATVSTEPSGAGAWRGRGTSLPAQVRGARSAEASGPPEIERPRMYAPFVSRSAAAPSRQASSAPLMSPRPATAPDGYAASTGYTAPGSRGGPLSAPASPAGPRYGGPSEFVVHNTGPSGGAPPPMPVHVEPRVAAAPPPAHAAPSGYGGPPPRVGGGEPVFSPPPAHVGGVQPSFSPAPRPGAAAGPLGGAAPHFGGGAAFRGRR